MVALDTLRNAKIALDNEYGTGIPALGFGTLIPDPVATRNATKAALEAGFRLFDSAERYRNEEAVGEAMQRCSRQGRFERKGVFVITKLWNNNHRPERVKPAFEASSPATPARLSRSLSHPSPFAFQPGDEQDPRDERGKVIYNMG